MMISQDHEAQPSEIRAQLDFETTCWASVDRDNRRQAGVDVPQVHKKVAERMATPKPASVEAGRLLEGPAHARQ